MVPLLLLGMDRIEAGRQLGHDYFRFTHLEPEPLWDAAMHEGFDSAQARRFKRQVGDRFVRKWLQVRTNALRRDRIVDQRMTPSFLRQLDVAVCPILRLPLTHGSQTDTDWSVDRLNNEGTYAPGNLAIISTLANRAKADHSFAVVHERASARENNSGLAPQEWMRMASLMLGPCFVEKAAAAPVLPLLTPLPPLTVRSATQMIQYALTIGTGSAAEKNSIIKKFCRHCTDSHARVHISQVAERIHIARKTVAVIWDVWDSPQIMRAFLSLRAAVPTHTWVALGNTAAIFAGGKPVPQTRLSTWHLCTEGHFAEYWRR